MSSTQTLQSPCKLNWDSHLYILQMGKSFGFNHKYNLLAIDKTYVQQNVYQIIQNT